MVCDLKIITKYVIKIIYHKDSLYYELRKISKQVLFKYTNWYVRNSYNEKC